MKFWWSWDKRKDHKSGQNLIGLCWRRCVVIISHTLVVINMYISYCPSPGLFIMLNLLFRSAICLFVSHLDIYFHGSQNSGMLIISVKTFCSAFYCGIDQLLLPRRKLHATFTLAHNINLFTASEISFRHSIIIILCCSNVTIQHAWSALEITCM